MYNIVDAEPAAVCDGLCPHLATAVGGKPPRQVPGWVGRAAIGAAGLRWMTESRGLSNHKAKRALNWRLRFPSWREGFCRGLRAAPLDADELDALIGPALNWNTLGRRTRVRRRSQASEDEFGAS
jgi:hypothetical protein